MFIPTLGLTYGDRISVLILLDTVDTKNGTMGLRMVMVEERRVDGVLPKNICGMEKEKRR